MSRKNIDLKKVFLKKLLQKAKNCDIITIREPTGAVGSRKNLIRKSIEVVITALTRNQVYRNVSWVRIPPLPPKIPRVKRGIFTFSLFTIHYSLFLRLLPRAEFLASNK